MNEHVRKMAEDAAQVTDQDVENALFEAAANALALDLVDSLGNHNVPPNVALLALARTIGAMIACGDGGDVERARRCGAVQGIIANTIARMSNKDLN
jgi:hypothetical protein